MAKLRAILVEDQDDEAALRFSSVIKDAGFQIARARTAVEAKAVLQENLHSVVDLVVLDRRLPADAGCEPVERVGDELLSNMVGQLRDAAFVVLTGYTDVKHTQWTLRDRGHLEHGHGLEFDRVTHFQKSDSLEFRDFIVALARILKDLEGIDVVSPAQPVGALRRLLKRTAQSYDGCAISARTASGGASDASVWICSVTDSSGAHRASLLLKPFPQDGGNGGTDPSIGAFVNTVAPILRLPRARWSAASVEDCRRLWPRWLEPRPSRC